MHHPLERAFHFFSPSRALSPEESLQVRVLIGGAALGLLVATASIVSTVLLYDDPPAIWIAAFGVGCVGLLGATRAGGSIQWLRRATLLLLGSFFTVQTLQTKVLDYGPLKWLILLPLVSVLLTDTRVERRKEGRSAWSLWTGTVFAIALAGFIIVASSRGWHADYEVLLENQHTAALAGFIDFALFAASVAGLLSVHRIAMRRMHEELQLLRSMIAVCAWCKRIRESDGRWIALEEYMAAHEDRHMSHGICPECELSLD